jgi:hypothetical protein
MTEITTVETTENQRDRLGRFIPGNTAGFKPGVAGHTLGRRDSLVDHLSKLGAEEVVEGKSRNHLLAWRAWNVALDPKTPLSVFVQVLQYLTERLYGKAAQSITLQARADTISDEELEDYLKELGYDPALLGAGE